jgi:hypothetical protein
MRIAPAVATAKCFASSFFHRSRRGDPIVPDETIATDDLAGSARALITHLETLGAELRRRGLAVRLSVPRGAPPNLHVVNPRASAMAETIVAEADWFRWSWCEPIAPVGDVAAAADRVRRVLAETDG